MVTTAELKQKIKDIQKYPETRNIQAASVCNDGFPGNFNLSFIESEWLEEFDGQFMDYSHDYIVSKIQPCIRHQDWELIRKRNETPLYHLGLFEMADIGGVVHLIDSSQLNQAASFSIQSLYSFLIDTLGLSRAKLRVKYCKGGEIAKLTEGKYSVDKKLPGDRFVNKWKNLGLKDQQLISDETRDTLLALNIYGVHTPWGYRNEILYEHDNTLLDIATFEYLCYRPVFEEEEMVGLKEWSHAFSIAVVGVERVLMVINSLPSVVDLDTVRPLVDKTLKLAKRRDESSAIVFVEALRVVQQVISECGTYEHLSRHRKRKIRDYYSGLLSEAKNLQFDSLRHVIEQLMALNAELRSDSPHLAGNQKVAVDEIIRAQERSTSV